MGLNYLNLDAATRVLMLEEIAGDAAENKLYFSSYLSDAGIASWPELLTRAAREGTDVSFGQELQQNDRINLTAQRRKPKGGFITVNVPVTAHETLSEGEFNRFYIRGVCRYAIDKGIKYVEVYRAKQVENARPSSEAIIGKQIDPAALLDDLRRNVGVETATGFPGPNSGLSVKLPK